MRALLQCLEWLQLALVDLSDGFGSILPGLTSSAGSRALEDDFFEFSSLQPSTREALAFLVLGPSWRDNIALASSPPPGAVVALDEELARLVTMDVGSECNAV
jgi:hypothetical protein